MMRQLAGGVLAEVSRPLPPARPAESALSERELEMLQLPAGGLMNREIALRVSLAQGTVTNYVTSILGKIGARDRVKPDPLVGQKQHARAQVEGPG
jgi:DNA-binding NarL/FixJ family response regulator